MHATDRFRRAVCGVACALLSMLAAAGEPCRVAFDMGSSGIRAGSSTSSVTTQADIDYLGPLWAERGLAETVAPTIAALRELPEAAGFDLACARVGGGFSAWRLALQQRPHELVATLERIGAASGVPVLVIPQRVEGGYGYFAARQLLGDKLTTNHVLDIGGGSLQIAGERTSFVGTLGQKAWHRALCRALRDSASADCALQPMTRNELAAARTLLADQLGHIDAVTPEPVTLTAISRPVTRGVRPAVERLTGTEGRRNRLHRKDLDAAIERIRSLTLEATVELVGSPKPYATYLLSDMLLVEGLMRMTGAKVLQVAEIDVTNLPGLLADDRAFAWSQHYSCYLERLRALGLEAYASDPATCE